MRVMNRWDFGFAALYNTVLETFLFPLAYLYWTAEIDWLAVNAGTATLTACQWIIHSDIIPVALHALFLLGAIILGWKRRRRGERDCRNP